jgi:hypothetical protein
LQGWLRLAAEQLEKLVDTPGGCAHIVLGEKEK